VLILRDGHPRRSQQQRSANPTHDGKSFHRLLTREL
jgi:hypothetical protein